MDKSEKVRSGKRRTLLIILGIVLALILVAMIVIIVWGKVLLGKINRVDGPVDIMSQEEQEAIRNETDAIDPDFDGPIMDSDQTEMPDGPADTVPDAKNIINILLVGQDRLPGQGRQRSDAMILCTVNKKEKTLVMTSFMRDTWIRIPGYYDERLNVPYAVAGFDLLNETLEYNFGVKADHMIEVDFSGFEKVIDRVGGVDITLTASEANHLNGEFGWYLSKGANHLTGAQALQYARIRAIDNDFKRTNRQRTVLNALFSQVKNLSVSELYKFVEGVLPFVTTDMTDGEILGYVLEIAPILSDLQLVSQRIPMDGAYAFASIDKKSVLYLNPENLEKNKQLLIDTIGNN